MYNNFEISLVVFMLKITTNDAIIYTNLHYNIHIHCPPNIIWKVTDKKKTFEKLLGYLSFQKPRC